MRSQRGGIPEAQEMRGDTAGEPDDDDQDDDEEEEAEDVEQNPTDDDDGGEGDDASALEAIADSIGELKLGTPFVFANNGEELKADCVFKCDCGQSMRLDLHSLKVKRCPSCKARYTHALIIAPVDDVEIVAETVHHVLRENGVMIPGADGGAGGDEGDDEGDDEGGDNDR